MSTSGKVSRFSTFQTGSMYVWGSLFASSIVFTVTKGSYGPTWLDPLSVLRGMEPLDACHRRMCPVAHPMRWFLQEGSKGHLSKGACDP